jgi:hypothetical protein
MQKKIVKNCGMKKEGNGNKLTKKLQTKIRKKCKRMRNGGEGIGMKSSLFWRKIPFCGFEFGHGKKEAIGLRMPLDLETEEARLGRGLGVGTGKSLCWLFIALLSRTDHKAIRIIRSMRFLGQLIIILENKHAKKGN